MLARVGFMISYAAAAEVFAGGKLSNAKPF